MKICIFASIFRPYTRGGAEVVVEYTVDALLQSGHEVIVVTTGPWTGFKSLWPIIYIPDILVGKLQIIRYYPLNLFSILNISKYPAWLRLPWHIFDLFNWHSYIIARLIMRRINPDLVLTHNLKGLGYMIMRAATTYARRYNKQYIHTVHDVQLVIPSARLLVGEENSRHNNSWYIKVFIYLTRWVCGSPSVVVSSSQFLLDFYNKKNFFKFSRKIILRNPVPLLLSRRLFIPKTSPINFLHVGQIEPHKGVIFLVETFMRLIEQLPNSATLTIVGGGSQLEYIKQYTQKCGAIIVMDYVPHEKIFDLIANAHATVFTSLCYENFPTIVSESLALGVPVVASAVGGMEQIKDKVNGYTYIPGNTADLLRVLIYCIKNPTKLVAMRTTAYNTAHEWMTEFYIKKLLSLK